MSERAVLFHRPVSFLVAVCVIASSLAGCIVPEAAPLLGHERKKRIFYDVVRGMQCEIRKAVRNQIKRDRDDHEWGERKLAWFENWQALIDLTVQIEDRFAFSPGVSLITPNWLSANVALADHTTRPVPQSYNFGIGGEFAYSPSRLDKVAFSYPFSVFLKEDTDDLRPCYNIAGVTIQSDLKLYDWLDDVLDPIKKCAFLGLKPDDEETLLESFAGDVKQTEECKKTDFTKFPDERAGPIKSFSHDVAFIVSFDVNATPAWNLVRVSTAGGKLFDASRTDTSRLIITLAAPAAGSGGATKIAAPRTMKARGAPPPPAGISPEALLTHNALQIGAAVRDALGR